MTNATNPRAKLLVWLLTAAMVLSLSPAFAPTAHAASGSLRIGIDDNVNDDTTDTKYYEVEDLGYFPELPNEMSLSYDGDLKLLILTIPGDRYEFMRFMVVGNSPGLVEGVALNITADTVIDEFQFFDELNDGKLDTLVLTSLNSSTLTLENFNASGRLFITGDININAPANLTLESGLKAGGVIRSDDLTISTAGTLNVGGISSGGDISIASTVNTEGTGIFSTPGNDITVKGSARVTVNGQMKNGASNSQFSAGGNLIIEDAAVVAIKGGLSGVSAWDGGELTVKDNATLTVEGDGGNGINSYGGGITIQDNAEVRLAVSDIGVINNIPHQSTPKLTVKGDAVLTVSGAEQGIYWGSGTIEIADRAVVTASGSKNAIETRFSIDRHGVVNITASPYVYKTSAAANGAGFTQGVYPGSAFVNSSEYKYVKILGGVSSDPNPTEPAAPTYPLQSISLNRASATLTTGSSIQLSVAYNPANTTDDRRVTWTSDTPSVATVNDAGLVTASNTTTGSAIITAKVGSHTATCNITVTEPASDPGLRPSGPSGGGGVSTPVEPKTEEEPPAQTQTQSEATGTETALAALRDVSASDWYYEDVKFVTENGLFKGVSATEFAPNAKMTRAMLATVLYRLAGEPAAPAGQGSFGDVPAGQWFSEAVAWASANGVVGGYGPNVFGTDDPVTREQIAVLLYRYAELMGYDVSASADLAAYTDATDISEWAREALAWANAAGLITGRGASALDPTDTATRAEVSAMLHRFSEMLITGGTQ
jgi:hypothetical protein